MRTHGGKGTVRKTLVREAQVREAQVRGRDDRRPVIEPLEARKLLSLPPGFAQMTWSTGLTEPTAMEFAPDGRLFVTEQAGAVRVVPAGGGAPLARPFATVPARYGEEAGLLAVAFDP